MVRAKHTLSPSRVRARVPKTISRDDEDFVVQLFVLAVSDHASFDFSGVLQEIPPF